MAESKHKYPACKDIQRKQPDFTVNQEVVDEIGANYRTLPLYEKFLYTNAYTRLYSLETNELLRCRWKEYIHSVGRIHEPFQFMNTRDMHFYLHTCQYKPSETIHKRLNHRNSLRVGPGVDPRGMIPIPQELLMKRLGGGAAHRKYPKKYPKRKEASEDAKKEHKKKT